MNIQIREVTRDNRADFEQLFESRGGPKACWCMVWRAMPSGAASRNGDSKKAAICSRINADIPVGLLGYLDSEPIAWCSVAPRSTFRKLGGPEDREDDPDAIWSLVCFFVKRQHRGHGIAGALFNAAIAHARSNGAKILEAYPVAPNSPSYRFMGFVPSFEKAGFQMIGKAGSRRHVMRLVLNP